MGIVPRGLSSARQRSAIELQPQLDCNARQPQILYPWAPTFLVLWLVPGQEFSVMVGDWNSLGGVEWVKSRGLEQERLPTVPRRLS